MSNETGTESNIRFLAPLFARGGAKDMNIGNKYRRRGPLNAQIPDHQPAALPTTIALLQFDSGNGCHWLGQRERGFRHPAKHWQSHWHPTFDV